MAKRGVGLYIIPQTCNKKPWAYICSKGFFCWAYFRGSLLLEGILRFKTASTNSPWAYIREELLSEEFLRLRFGGLILVRAYLFIYLFIFWEGGGGGYYRNFTVFDKGDFLLLIRKKAGFFLASQRKTPTVQKNRVIKTQKATRQAQIKKSKS